MTKLSISVLGGLDIKVAGGDGPLDFPTRKTKALLAYLALSPGMTRSREHLAGTLWERSAEEQGRASLRQTLSSLRKTLSSFPDSIVETNAHSVWLNNERVNVDALLFKQLAIEQKEAALEQAVALYKGEFLSDFGLREHSFEEWLTNERRYYDDLAIKVYSELLRQLVNTGRHETSIPVAEQLLSMDPLQEWAHFELIRSYSESGQRSAALRQFQDCVRILDRELGVKPGENILRLAERVRLQNDDQSPIQATGSLNLVEPPIQPKNSVEDHRLPAAWPSERKQLTVLCARIHELADSQDPEATLERLEPLLGIIVNAVKQYGGTVSAVHDDAVTALFGAPRAQEDHAIRSCYASLAIRDALTAQAGTFCDLRIGIHSGEAVVRSIDDGATRHYHAVGSVAQIARYIDSALKPGQIGLTVETSRQAAGFFELTELADAILEDMSEPLTLFSLDNRTSLRSRWEARSVHALTEFVGRESELAKLDDLLLQTESGHSQVVAIVGDPGVGKSRLLHEFIHSDRTEAWTILETGTASHDSNTTYRPIKSLLQNWVNISKLDTQAEAEKKLCNGIAKMDPLLQGIVPPLLALLDLPVADTEWLTLAPAQKRQRTLDAIKTAVMRSSQTESLIVVVEDLHWADPGTQSVLDHLVDGLGLSRVLLLVTYRPEYSHNWLSKTFFTQLRLDPLDVDNADLLLGTLLGKDSSLKTVRTQLIEQGDGTPLFLEESVQALVETGALGGEQGAYRLIRPVDDMRIPSTVQAVYAARIDRLPDRSRELLQTAAVVGKNIQVELLEQLVNLDQENLSKVLAELQGAEFLYQTRTIPNPEYTFKHALTHQVAYETLLKERRRDAHVRLVAIIEELYGDRLDQHVERLAYHALNGEKWSAAIAYLIRSASKAIQRSAHQTAIGYLEQGLKLIAEMPTSAERHRLELDYRKALGVSMMAARGWAATEVLDAYTRARELCELLGDEHELFIALRGQGQYHMIRGEIDTAKKLGDRCVGLASKSRDMGVQIETHHLFWSNSFFMGDYKNARHHSGKGIELYESERDHPLTYIYSGHDPGVCCRIFSALIQCLNGALDQSLRQCQQALDLAKQLNHPLTIALAQWALSYVYLLRDEPQHARKWAEKEITICEEYHLPLLHSQGMFQLGWSLARMGELDNGIARMRDGLVAISGTGAEMGLPYFCALLGEALGRAGESEDGIKTLNRGLDIASHHGARLQYSEMLRLKGELRLASGMSDSAAESCFRDALNVASQQGAVLPQLRSGISLARLLSNRGDVQSARSILRPLYKQMAEGLETPILKDAAMLLDSLGAG